MTANIWLALAALVMVAAVGGFIAGTMNSRLQVIEARGHMEGS